MVNLSTTYMGLNLRSPLVASASPLSRDISGIKRLEDGAASAVVLYSLFEEQLELEQLELHHHTTHGADSFAEAPSYIPELPRFNLGPDGYLEHIRKAKEATNIPIIASLNAYSTGGWTSFAAKMEQAGADGLELNIYNIPTSLDLSAAEVEQSYLDIVTAVKSAVTIPVAIKLSPYFSSMGNMAKRLDDAGANALVLFNRFYQPDIDLETLEVVPNVLLSTPQATRLPLRWIAILYGRIRADLGATSGVHRGVDAIKMLMAGASVAMMTSSLLRNGPGHIATVEQELVAWMQEHEYESVAQMRGSMSQQNSADPSAYERAQYMRALTNYTSHVVAARR